MVTDSLILVAGMPLQVLGKVDVNKPVLEQLPADKRVAVVMALLGIVLIGLFLIVFVMVGGHWVRRMARHRPGEDRRKRVESARKDAEFRETLQAVVPDAKTDDTIQLGTSSKDTKVDG